MARRTVQATVQPAVNPSANTLTEITRNAKSRPLRQGSPHKKGDPTILPRFTPAPKTRFASLMIKPVTKVESSPLQTDQLVSRPSNFLQRQDSQVTGRKQLAHSPPSTRHSANIQGNNAPGRPRMRMNVTIFNNIMLPRVVNRMLGRRSLETAARLTSIPRRCLFNRDTPFISKFSLQAMLFLQANPSGCLQLSGSP